MKQEDFVHLHCHSTYSLLEGLPSPKEIVGRAHELNQSAVALTDKGYTYGLIEFYKEARSQDIQPILGIEAFVASRSRHDREKGVDTKRYPLVLLAETQKGYENLLHLATTASLEGMYYKPRVDDELLAKYGEGLIALTGPISGAIPQAALIEDKDCIEELLEKYRSFFGKNNVYFELMDLPNVIGQSEINQQLIAWGKEFDVPLVATCNSYYCRPEDAEAQDVLLCIQKNSLVDDPNRFTMRDSDFSMRSFEDMERAFSHVSQALENTRKIADRCSVDFELESAYHIPTFPVPTNETEDEYLQKLCMEGLKKRYKNPTKLHEDRMNHELFTIAQMGFSGYFLIVADFVNEARKRGITVGPGRGSAAGSIVSYCLQITSLDPLEHGLIFERFLNPERISMPDIDMDFADNRRDEVLNYVREKYGEDRVIQICTFGTLAARAAVKDVGRAYGIPFLEMNSLAKLIPERPGTTLKEALETDELQDAYKNNETYKRIIDTAKKLEGKARHVSIHACGVIITPEPAVTYTALQKAPKDDNTTITQYSAKPIEALGLLKMDFLGLTNLTVIQTTLEIIKRTQEEDIDINAIPMNDKKTFKLLQKGETTGVFQFESAGMRRYLKQLKPTTFQDITAMAALYRPGPMEWIPHFIKRQHGKERVTYPHPSVKEVFEETYGIGVYQEQILKLAQIFAGFSLGEADLLRRAIGKKIKKELDAQRAKFVEGAMKNEYEKGLAEKIFDDVITPFAGYGFPKSHSAGYALIAYQTAYLKAHYPTEFMAALLSSDAGRTDRIMVEIDECRLMGIDVRPPDINQSLRNFTALPKENAIRFGLAAIKGIGESSVLNILQEREENGKFESLEDFARRVPLKVLNKKLIESLAKSGALDSLGDRKTLIEHYEMIVEYRKACGESDGGQVELFAGFSDSLEESKITFPPCEPAPLQQTLHWEKESLGLYVSSHPLAGLKKYIGKKARLISDLTVKEVGKKITITGIQEGIKKIKTKKGEMMAAVFIEDPTGKMEITLFPRIYSTVSDILEKEDTVLVIGGTLDLRGGQLQLRADAIKRASLSTMIKNAKSSGFFDEEEAKKGLSLVRQRPLDQEAVEMIDDEGNIIAGETLIVEKKENENGKEQFLGPIGMWISKGMEVTDILKKLHIKRDKKASTDISIHTIDLPARAPKQLLLELKKVFELFPGKEKVQLQIGEQGILLPLTIAMSPILEKKIEEVIEKYAVTI
jgi:DNA polymerase III subunit alpha